MFGELPAWGFYVRHATGIKMNNIKLSYKEDDFRAAMIFDDVERLSLNNINIKSAKEMPVLVFNNVRQLSQQNIVLPVEDSKAILTTNSR